MLILRATLIGFLTPRHLNCFMSTADLHSFCRDSLRPESLGKGRFQRLLISAVDTGQLDLMEWLSAGCKFDTAVAVGR